MRRSIAGECNEFPSPHGFAHAEDRIGYEKNITFWMEMTLGTIGFEGRFDYAAIGTVSNVASRLCDEAKPGHADEAGPA
jgi:hypothetical protein